MGPDSVGPVPKIQVEGILLRAVSVTMTYRFELTSSSTIGGCKKRKEKEKRKKEGRVEEKKRKEEEESEHDTLYQQKQKG